MSNLSVALTAADLSVLRPLQIKVVVSAHNDNSKPYNLTAIMASLNSPMDFSMYIQNFTQMVYFEPLPPGEEVSLEYIFRPDPILSPREFTVAVHLFYEDPEGNFYSNTVFNSTVDIVEMPKLVDTEMVFMYLTLAALFGIAGYFAYTSLAEKVGLNKMTKTKKVKKVDGAKVQLNEDEWLKGSPYEVSQRKKATQRTTKQPAVAAQ
eukprot:jgi/Chrzof1/4220/Cz14g03170.t1